MENADISVKKQKFMMKMAKVLFDPEVIFEEENIVHYLEEHPCVIICNHSRRTPTNVLTSCDGPIVRYALGNKKICSLMGADLMKNPFFNLVISGCDCIPVNRNSASTDWIHKCRKKLKDGYSVVIFPEGTTFKEKDVDLFKPGFALLATLADVPVIPVAISGVYRPFTKRKLKLKIGKPMSVETAPGTKASYEKETVRFQQIVKEMHTDINKEHQKAYSI